MIDREKAIKGLGCLADENSACHSDCPYFTDREEGGFCFRKMAHDALELLKDEPLSVLNVGKCGIYFGDCPHCGKRVTKKNTSYCPYCGKAVKWDG